MSAILRLPEVIQRTGLSRSSIYLRVNRGTFPPPVKLGGPRAVGWPEPDVDQIIDAYIAGESTENIQQLVSTLEATRGESAARGRS